MMKKICIALILMMGSISFAEPTKRKGTYTVPSSFENAPFSTFEMAEILWDVQNPKITVTYRLPPQLVGADFKHLVLEGIRDVTSDIVILKGVHGEAHCISDQSKNFICIVKFKAMGEFLSKAETYIKEKYKSKKLLEKRLEVARAFSGEPIGIIQFRKE